MTAQTPAGATPVVLGRGPREQVLTDTRTRRRLVRAELAVLLMGGVLVGGWLLAHEVASVTDGAGPWFALLFAAIVPPLLTVLVLWLNAVRPLPWPALVAAFAWGAFGASAISLHLNSWLAPFVGDTRTVSARSAVFVAPWTEEAAKAIVVLVIALWAAYWFDSVTSGAVVGALSGIGFAFAENLFYYAAAYRHAVAVGQEEQAVDAVRELFLLRGVLSPFVHPMFSMATGIGVGLAVRHRHVALRVIAPVAGFTVAVCLHMGYNALASFSDNEGFRVAYVMILLPLVMTMIGTAALLRRHESRLLAARLGDYVSHGWLGAAHVTYTMTRRGRREARQYVKPLGRDAGRLVRQLQREAQRLAVLRDRMVRGVAGPASSAHESAALERITDLRTRVILPEHDGLNDAHLTRAASSW